MASKLRWRDVARAILSGLDTVTFSVSAGVRELLIDRLDRNEDTDWKNRVEDLMKQMDQRLESLQSEDRLALIASLARTIPPEALAKMGREAKDVENAVDYNSPPSLDRFWRELLNSVKPEDLAEPDISLYRQELIERIPISPKIIALLDADRAYCENANLPYRSAHMLHSLLASENGFAANSFDAGAPGLAKEIREKLEIFIEHEQANQDRGSPYESFSWEEHPIIRAAKRLAFLDAYPVLNEKYLILALLDSQARTIVGLRNYVDERHGRGVFGRIQDYAVTHAPAIAQVGGTGPVFQP